MKLAIMQPYFFPYIGYFQLIHSVDKFMIYENVSFRKKGWMSRNYIKPRNGETLMIHIPVAEKSSFKPISEIVLAVEHNWRQKLSKTIFFAYKNARFFEEVYPIFEDILKCDCHTLHEFNSYAIVQLCHGLGINTCICCNNSSYRDIESQLGEQFDEVLPERKIMRIIEICKNERTDTYHNLINGQALYPRNEFEKHGIELKFVKTDQINYPQFEDCFSPNLSIIDVMMHCGPKKTVELLSQYSLF